jgi:hypothetical protein
MEASMPKSSKQHLVLTVTAVFVLLAPGIAFAGGKGGSGGKQAGSDRPTENLSLNYGKVEHTYTQKNKASPNLLKDVNKGKHYSKTSN